MYFSVVPLKPVSCIKNISYSRVTPEAIIQFRYSPEKWLYNGICYPSNRSKQIQETHMAYSAGTQFTRQSLNETQQTWLHRQQVIVCEVMYAVFHSNFAAYIVCRRYKPCGFLGLAWTNCWGNKSNYVITSPANYGLRLHNIGKSTQDVHDPVHGCCK